jgi:DedD protein
MSDEKPLSVSPASADLEAEQRNVIVRRLTLAAILALGLLGLLVLFDTFSTAPEESEPTPYPDVVPVPPKRQIVQPVTFPPEAEELQPGEPDLSELLSGEETLLPPEMPPVPPLTEVPDTATQPIERPVTRPATPTTRSAQAAAPPPQAGVVAPEFTAPLPPATPQPAGTDRPPQSPVIRPQPVPPPPSLPEFVVQAGVFANFQRAEEIHARLTLHGIPSTLETRVNVGPFKTRAEAEAAYKKIRELGIEGVILPPARSRP